jgi:hypothetical protein
VNDDSGDIREGDDAQASAEAGPFRYHLELTPSQLKITHTALRSLLDDFGHDEPEVVALIQEVLAKLPDEHAIRAIQLGSANEAADVLIEGGEPDQGGPPPSAA